MIQIVGVFLIVAGTWFTFLTLRERETDKSHSAAGKINAPGVQVAAPVPILVLALGVGMLVLPFFVGGDQVEPETTTTTTNAVSSTSGTTADVPGESTTTSSFTIETLTPIITIDPEIFVPNFTTFIPPAPDMPYFADYECDGSPSFEWSFDLSFPIDGFLVTVQFLDTGDVLTFDWFNGSFDGFWWDGPKWCLPPEWWDSSITYRIWVQSYNGVGLSDFSPPVDF